MLASTNTSPQTLLASLNSSNFVFSPQSLVSYSNILFQQANISLVNAQSVSNLLNDKSQVSQQLNTSLVNAQPVSNITPGNSQLFMQNSNAFQHWSVPQFNDTGNLSQHVQNFDRSTVNNVSQSQHHVHQYPTSQSNIGVVWNYVIGKRIYWYF